MAWTRIRLRLGVLAAGASLLTMSPAWAQATKAVVPPVPSSSITAVEQPDAQRTREALARLLERYPPALKGVLTLDPSLLGNQTYLAPYPALVGFLSVHPEIARNPSFYLGESWGPRYLNDRRSPGLEVWNDVIQGLGIFGGFGMAIGLIVWLIRTLVDYRRWSRLAKVQTDAHTKLLDRFTANDDLLAYIQSPAGAKFLQSSPIKLDAGPRSMSAPLSRILWSVQGGMVLVAGGIGFMVVSGQVIADASQPIHALGVIGIALGVGFVLSAILSFVISHRLGLIETAPAAPRSDSQGV